MHSKWFWVNCLTIPTNPLEIIDSISKMLAYFENQKSAMRVYCGLTTKRSVGKSSVFYFAFPAFRTFYICIFIYMYVYMHARIYTDRNDSGSVICISSWDIRIRICCSVLSSYSVSWHDQDAFTVQIQLSPDLIVCLNFFDKIGGEKVRWEEKVWLKACEFHAIQ